MNAITEEWEAGVARVVRNMKEQTAKLKACPQNDPVDLGSLVITLEIVEVVLEFNFKLARTAIYKLEEIDNLLRQKTSLGKVVQ